MNKEEVIMNAVIESATIEIEDHGFLDAWLHLNFGGSGQGFGGYVLYLPKDFSHHKLDSGFAGHFIYRCLQVAGVSRWADLKNKTVRVKKEGHLGKIIAIGHIVNDDWFCPAVDFEREAEAA